MAFVEDFFQIIYEVHATSKGHIGTKRLWRKLESFMTVFQDLLWISMSPCAHEETTNYMSTTEAYFVFRFHDKRAGT